MKLRDALPYDFFWGEYDTSRAMLMIDIEVVSTHDGYWIGKEKNVHVWWALANGYAVGWNENPCRGWSFPVCKLPNTKPE